ncbi:MAG: NAD(P)H-binding protein [Thermodesulfobacteriota bacterium]
MPPVHCVTGAFGFSGSYIAKRLLAAGLAVQTLTGSLERASPLRPAVRALPFHFDHFEQLVQSLRGVAVLYNTYWVRFNYRDFGYAQAVRHSATLLAAAKEAGVGRIVQISITNAAEDSPLEYFRGKAEVERLLAETGIPYTVLRPALLFGPEDIVINNIAWLLRHLPVFPLFGLGRYRLRPVFVDDLAALAVAQGAAAGRAVIDAVGPETFSFRDLVATIGRAIGKNRPRVPVPPALGFLVARLAGLVVHDVVVTRDEITGLMQGLLDVPSPATGDTRLTAWLAQHGATIGRHYAGELSRRDDRRSPYSRY